MIKIDRVHFYVEDARAWRNWFVQKLGFQAVASGSSTSHTCTEVVNSGEVYFALSSPLTPLSPVANFLRQHPPGVADVAFCVEDIEAVMQGAIAWGAQVLQPIQHQQGFKWAKIAAWGSLTHTLIERQEAGGKRQEVRGKRQEAKGSKQEANLVHPTLGEGQNPTSFSSPLIDRPNSPSRFTFAGIDHIVLNVAAGDLERAVAWYENVLGFHAQQAFKIQTDRSALHSRVLVSSNKCVQFPINQPASPNSQIQEFLDFNQGAGIQHIALQIPNIVQAIASFRSSGVSFLSVPPTYYTQLQERLGLPLSVAELKEIAAEQILVDWQENNPHALLLQTFTQPIFTQPTFFFEIIERRSQALGFGEGNFRALFEAIEREQIKRGSLSSS